uniref:Integrase n=1 Tax=Solanum tuberosum TaxID=4113 RepID=M1D637_SOLTU
MIRAFHKKVRARIFEIGQLVLKRIFPHQDEYKGKFAPNWQGPYMVRKVLSGGALILSEMDGTEWPKPSTQMLSRDTMCEISVCISVIPL